MTPPAILITGASSGIGRELARQYAQRQPAPFLGLVARRAEPLEDTAKEARALGAQVTVIVADVCDGPAMTRAVQDFARESGGLTLVIANAGIHTSDRLSLGDSSRGSSVIAVNVQGVINTLVPAIPLMQAQGSGHLAAIGSVAGFRGFYGKGAYCASKAAVRTLLEAWRPGLREKGIHVSYIAPGWIDTELTQGNPYRMPFILPVEKATRMIIRALDRRKTQYVFPWQMRLISLFLPWAPDFLMPKHASKL